jgi:hypothetical protein
LHFCVASLDNDHLTYSVPSSWDDRQAPPHPGFCWLRRSLVNFLPSWFKPSVSWVAGVTGMNRCTWPSPILFSWRYSLSSCSDYMYSSSKDMLLRTLQPNSHPSVFPALPSLRISDLHVLFLLLEMHTFLPRLLG